MVKTTLVIADDLTLPLEAVTEKLAFLGRTGSGKTYAAMKLAELMLAAGAQVGAIDPVGVWRALRVPAEKGGQSFDVVVFGGLYGDLPLEGTEHAGTVVADLVCDRGLSFVLDVSQFIPAEQQRVVRAFADRFFHRRKSAPAAVHLFMEECQEFIPENPSHDEAKTLGVMQRLWKLGRNFGIGGSLLSQRPQEISKKALNMSGTLFAFQMTGPQERKAVRSWVADHGVATDIESVLQKLRVGEPHVESATFLQVSKTIRILPRVTADLSSTPKVGANQVAKRALTPIDVEQLRSALKDTIDRAKADDPKELRKQLADKDRRLKELERTTSRLSSSSDGKRTEVPVLTEADRALLKELREEFWTFNDNIGAKADAMLTSLAERAKAAIDDALGKWTVDVDRRRELFAKRLEAARVQKVLGKLEQLQAPPPPRHTPPAQRTTPVRPPAAPSVPRVTRTAPAAAHGQGLSKGERTVLTAVAQYPDGLSREQLTTLTTYKRSTRDLYLQQLGRRGTVGLSGGRIVVTPEGMALLGDDFDPLPTGDALLEHWRSKLPAGERSVLDALVSRYPRGVHREEVSEVTGYKRSTRDLYIQQLQRRQLVRSRDGLLLASEELFG